MVFDNFFVETDWDNIFVETQIETLLALANFTFSVLMSTHKSFFKCGQSPKMWPMTTKTAGQLTNIARARNCKKFFIQDSFSTSKIYTSYLCNSHLLSFSVEKWIRLDRNLVGFFSSSPFVFLFVLTPHMSDDLNPNLIEISFVIFSALMFTVCPHKSDDLILNLIALVCWLLPYRA